MESKTDEPMNPKGITDPFMHKLDLSMPILIANMRTYLSLPATAYPEDSTISVDLMVWELREDNYIFHSGVTRIGGTVPVNKAHLTATKSRSVYRKDQSNSHSSSGV